MFDGLKDKKRLEKVKDLWRESYDADRGFQKEALEDFAFKDGHGQWTDEERKILADELRPCLTFNLIRPVIELVMGVNDENRVVYRAIPQEQDDEFLCEVLNDVDNWVYEHGEFEEVEDGAKESAAVCGRGYVGIDFLPDPKRLGEVVLTEVDIPIHEVKMVPNGTGIFWEKWISAEDFKIRYPGYASKIDEIITEGASSPENLTPLDEGDIFEEDPTNDDDYSQSLDMSYYDKRKGLVRVIHFEYYQNYLRYYAFNPEQGEWVEIEGKDEKEIKQKIRHLDALFPLKYGKELAVETVADKRVMWFQYTGDYILYDEPSPLPYDGFSIVPCRLNGDSSKKTNMDKGIVRDVKDPQREVNKRWSQWLNLLNQQQPGMYAEAGAFVDQRQAEESIKEAGSITWLQDGALRDNKFQERAGATLPAGVMQMEDSAQNMIKRISGINHDLMGQDLGRQEPGIAIRLRQQQGLKILNPLFRKFKRLQEGLFKRRLAIITAFMPDKQIMRILGQNDRYVIQDGIIIDKKTGQTAMLRDIRNVEYNVAAEEAPGNMSKRMMELGVLMEMAQYQVPVDPRVMVQMTDLPSSMKSQWIEYIENQMQSSSESAEKQAQLEEAKILGEQALKGKTLEADFTIKQEKAQAQRDKDKARLKFDATKVLINDATDRLRIGMDYGARMAQVNASKQRGESEVTRSN